MRLFEICGLCFFLLAADLALFCAYWEVYLVWSSSFGSGRIEVFRLIGFDRKLWFKLVGKTDEKLVWQPPMIMGCATSYRSVCAGLIARVWPICPLPLLLEDFGIVDLAKEGLATIGLGG